MVGNEGITERVGGSDGMARLKVLTAAGQCVYVGAFANMVEATSFGKALARCKKLVAGVKLEHKNRGSWKPAKTLVLALLALAGLAFTGCAGLRGELTPTPDEAAFIGDVRVRAHNVGRALEMAGCSYEIGEPARLTRIPRGPCSPPIVIVEPKDRGIFLESYKSSAAYYSATRGILVTPALLHGNPAGQRAILAHELSHWLHYDPWRIRNGSVTPQQAEMEANWLAIRVLMIGWGMPANEAAWLMWQSLVLEAALSGDKVQIPGIHESPCAEARDFRDRLERSGGKHLDLPAACGGGAA